MSTRIDIERERMKHAFEAAEKDGNKNYDSYVNKIPALIHTNGLGNAFAFIANQDKEWEKVVDAIYNWLARENSPFKESMDAYNKSENKGLKIVFGLKNMDDSQYRAATTEVLSYLNWLRRFSKAHRKNKSSNEKENNSK